MRRVKLVDVLAKTGPRGRRCFGRARVRTEARTNHRLMIRRHSRGPKRLKSLSVDSCQLGRDKLEPMVPCELFHPAEKVSNVRVLPGNLTSGRSLLRGALLLVVAVSLREQCFWRHHLQKFDLGGVARSIEVILLLVW